MYRFESSSSEEDGRIATPRIVDAIDPAKEVDQSEEVDISIMVDDDEPPLLATVGIVEEEALLDHEQVVPLSQRNQVLWDKVVQAVEDLKTKGYAIIERVFGDETEEKMADYTSGVWDVLEAASARLCPVDQRSAYDLLSREEQHYKDFPASSLLPHKHGIVESAGFNHCDVARRVRREPVILDIVAAIFGTDRLVCSLDRVNFKFPGRRYWSQDDWDHADQNPRALGLRCIQMYLNVFGTSEDEPGNRFYEGSHLQFEKFFEPHRAQHMDRSNWLKLEPTDRTELALLCKLVKPVCAAGSLVLWDSRVVHSPSDGTDFERGRLVFYLCYMPYDPDVFTAKEEKKKKQAFLERRATPHTPFPQTLFPKCPRVYGGKEFRYKEFALEDLCATKLKNIADAEQRKRIMDDFEQPCNQTEELLFGFRSYGSLPSADVGLAGKRWPKDVPPLLTLVSQSTPFVSVVCDTASKTRKKSSNIDSDYEHVQKKHKKS